MTVDRRNHAFVLQESRAEYFVDGEHGYIVSGAGEFGGKRLAAGDAFWMEPGERHDVKAITDLVFFAVSLPRSI